ncbi:hypothetical protein HMN09_01182600 [Mycena chlorophos]|uniref:Uncharacterized protein n=1 Tax=Mycena chlorophos TaxID=658473 RepID=A0A8H6S7Z6_MYCCL|nr:hypothetical protein HMN09_01182600 [Mycena chlorophos]
MKQMLGLVVQWRPWKHKSFGDPHSHGSRLCECPATIVRRDTRLGRVSRMQYKFSTPGYAAYDNVIEAISACSLNCTHFDNTCSSYLPSIDMCDAILRCVEDNLDNVLMAQYGAAATILGFIPTILSMVGTNRGDHLKIHRRFPILALLLSCCNPSTSIVGLIWRARSPPEDIWSAEQDVNPSRRHGLPIAFLLHLLTAAAAGLVLWQAVVLGMRGVISFACPTWINPLIWVLVGLSAHLIDVLVKEPLKMRWPRAMRAKEMALTVLALADYIYGTIILSSMQLVAPNPALIVTVIFALPATFAKLVAIFLLERAPAAEEPAAIPLLAAEEGARLKAIRRSG